MLELLRGLRWLAILALSCIVLGVFALFLGGPLVAIALGVFGLVFAHLAGIE